MSTGVGAVGGGADWITGVICGGAGGAGEIRWGDGTWGGEDTLVTLGEAAGGREEARISVRKSVKEEFGEASGFAGRGSRFRGSSNFSSQLRMWSRE